MWSKETKQFGFLEGNSRTRIAAAGEYRLQETDQAGNDLLAEFAELTPTIDLRGNVLQETREQQQPS